MSPLIDEILRGGMPTHVALIMDGNGRWAESQGLPRTAGYHAGAVATERLIRFVVRRLHIPYITLFAFSTENWKRPKDEVDFVMKLLERFIQEKKREFVDAGVHLQVAGDLAALPSPLRDRIRDTVRATESCDALHLVMALNYGARQEIVRACAQLGEEIAAGRLSSRELDEQSIASRLYTADVPDPDLIIRTSGELRLSNFLLWQAAYAELYFTDALWPDFTPARLIAAISDFQGRSRRFGGAARKESR